jgi:hypothetical protein
MPTENTSLINPASTFFNSTHSKCLLEAIDKGKRLNFLDLNREIKLDEIANDLNCAIEKYGIDKKVIKNPAEDQLDFIGRIINRLSFFQKFSRFKDAEDTKFNFIQTRVMERF